MATQGWRLGTSVLLFRMNYDLRSKRALERCRNETLTNEDIDANPKQDAARSDMSKIASTVL